MRALALVAALLGVPLGACSAETDALVITDARVNPPLGGRDVGAAYFTMRHGGGDKVLVGAKSGETDVIEIHRSSRVDGVARMERLDTYALRRGDNVFEQGGLHLMLFGFTADEAADGVTITLSFDDGTTVDVAFAPN